MTASYVPFVQKLRARFPRTQIVALRPFGGPFEAAIRRAVETLHAAGIIGYTLLTRPAGWTKATLWTAFIRRKPVMRKSPRGWPRC